MDATYRRLMDADVLVLAARSEIAICPHAGSCSSTAASFTTTCRCLWASSAAYLVSGPLTQNANLRQVLEAYVELQQASLAGIVSDDCCDGAELDAALDGLDIAFSTCAATGYLAPPTFLGVGGHKLFRDAIWGNLRFVFHADHRYYKRHGLYAFPDAV